MKYYLLVLFIILITACGQTTSEEVKNYNPLIRDSLAIHTVHDRLNLTSEEMFDMIHAVNYTPLEMANLILETGVRFSDKLLNPVENYNSYNTTYKKAINLGIYSADLGYINLYNQSGYSVKYLENVKKLADELNIGQFIDFKELKRMGTQNESLDSLVHHFMLSFYKMNDHLKQQNNGNISIMLLTGGWTEGMYFLTNTYLKYPEMNELKESIGEQKIPLNNISMLLSAYPDDIHFQNIKTFFDTLSGIYGNVNITTVNMEPQTDIINGELIITEKNTSSIIISDDQISEIIVVIKKLREVLIN